MGPISNNVVTSPNLSLTTTYQAPVCSSTTPAPQYDWRDVQAWRGRPLGHRADAGGEAEGGDQEDEDEQGAAGVVQRHLRDI